ncbi:MAG: type II secretion system F family protein [Kiritimatiellae bacterium]|nr:type II secretion system F family protein [Kiritimatiellia bacterium]
MAIFQYKAKDAEGNEVFGEIEAASRSEAIAAVRAERLFPTALGEVVDGEKPEADQRAAAPRQPRPPRHAASPARRASAAAAKPKGKGLNREINIDIHLPSWLQGRIKTKILTQFTRMLATLVNAGLPLMRGLDVLKQQMKNRQLLDALGGITENIAAGGTFSESLQQYPKIFDNLYVSMVKAGEAGGVLEVVLSRLAEFAEKSEKIKNKVKGAMIYPVIVLVSALVITALLMIFVVPKFQQVFMDMLNGQELPALTRIVVDVSQWVQHNWNIVLIIGAAVYVIKKVVGKTPAGAYFYDVVALKFPVTGTLVQRTAISRMTRTLGTLLSSGVPILQSLNIVRDTTGNLVVSKAIENVHEAVKEGEGMTAPLAQCPVFPPMVVSMVQVGEETGALADMLNRVADTYDDEVDNAVAGLTAAIEPVLIIFLAVVVGTIVIAMFLPMVKLISSLSGPSGGM